MTCPVCNRSDTAYLTCNRPDCTDGRHVPSTRSAPPVKTVQIEGAPITEALYVLFAPWGVVSGIAIHERGICVRFEGGRQLTFIPVAEGVLT